MCVLCTNFCRANWMFEVEKFDAATSTIHVGKGGFQGARGGPGSDWFISNILEELDAPGEFYYSRSDQTLYLYSNTTANSSNSRSGCTVR